MNKNMSFTQYQQKYITSFECQYDTLSNWGFYINIDNSEDNQIKHNIKNTNVNIDDINYINESMMDENVLIEYENKYISQPIFNCLLKVTPCIFMLYCFI